GWNPLTTNQMDLDAEQLPNVPVNALVLDPDDPNRQVYIGTDVGVYVRARTGTTYRWERAGGDPPHATLPYVKGPALQVWPPTRKAKVRAAATYGRGAWTFPRDGPRGTGRLGSRAWYDLAANGIRDPGEPGAASVPVTLLDDLGNVVSTTLTDADGYYQF